jgi:hypothetical protein
MWTGLCLHLCLCLWDLSFRFPGMMAASSTLGTIVNAGSPASRLLRTIEAEML